MSRAPKPDFPAGVSALTTIPTTLSSPPRQTSRTLSHQSQNAMEPAIAKASMSSRPHGKVAQPSAVKTTAMAAVARAMYAAGDIHCDGWLHSVYCLNPATALTAP